MKRDPRTKLAVLSHNPDVDAVGACIGSRGSRVSNIVSELGGEKIDIIEYSDDPEKFIAAALSPADVVSVVVTDPDARCCRVTVPRQPAFPGYRQQRPERPPGGKAYGMEDRH